MNTYKKVEIHKEDFNGGFTPIVQKPEPIPEKVQVQKLESEIKPVKMQKPSKYKKMRLLIASILITNLLFYEPFIFSKFQKIILSILSAFIIILIDFFIL
jgi:hypothetical protein